MSHKEHAHKKPRIEVYKNIEELNKEVGQYISDILTQYVDKPVLLLVPGGSAMAALDHISPETFSPDLTVTMTDDRFSDQLDKDFKEINNFAVLQTTKFYDHLIQTDAFCINTQINEGESFEEYRARFEKNIRDWRNDYPKGKVIALYGMGADGHTGGMVPGSLSEAEFNTMFDGDNLVGKIDAGSSNPYLKRISTTLPFMREWVDHAVFYITGEQKRSALERALKDDGEYFETPALVMGDMKDAVIFTDISLV